MFWHLLWLKSLWRWFLSIPCYGLVCGLHGFEASQLSSGEELWQHYSLIFQTSTPALSAVSTADSLKGWCSPCLSETCFKEDVERKCCIWYRVTILVFLFSISSLLLRILTPQKFLINSVALQRQANIWSYQVRKAIRPGSSMDFLPFAPSSAAGHCTNPDIVGWRCQGLEQLRANCFTQKIMG